VGDASIRASGSAHGNVNKNEMSFCTARGLNQNFVCSGTWFR